jgi:sigma54-dependent transcription regulator
MRGSMREISAAMTSHAKSATTSAETIAVVAREISSLRELNAEQVATIETLTDGFEVNGNGSAEPLA